ncbi:MAG: TonB-dependent receptor domain-containing protein [Candidatus Acidiferrales bacterium]
MNSRRNVVSRLMLVCAVALMLAVGGAAQVNTANLSGHATDASGAVVPGAQVSVKNIATGATRTQTSDEEGSYQFIGLPPGRYEISVKGAGFQELKSEIILTIGQEAVFNSALQVEGSATTVTVDATTEVIETNRTSVAETVDQRRIENLPINGRNYINFTLTTSQAARDSAPSIGAAPTSGLNFGGQRARSNQVSVDGADATDNSVNGVRATVSQEAVQEFQLQVSNYNAEFGRATGGVINIVTKSGTNEVHGNLFGYLRHKNIQARNPFSVEVDATGAVSAVKQEYTRVQAGATIGGPIVEDKTFYFFSYETTRRQETGFTNIGANNFGLVPLPAAFGGLLVTQAQFNLITNPGPLGPAVPAMVALWGSSSNVALTGIDPGLISMAGPGARFPLPCQPPSCTAPTLVGLPGSYTPLTTLRGNYPISEGTSLWSARLDHRWGDRDDSFVRLSVAPSTVTGISVNAQNQNFGQNAGSRTSEQQTRDLGIVGQHTRLWSDSFLTEARFQFARRGLGYRFASLPGGSDVAVNILGFAHFGREPFSTVDRIERRWQWTGNNTWVAGRHTLKFGGDFNLIQLRGPANKQIFELNFGGLYNFSTLDSLPLVNALIQGGGGTPLPPGTVLPSVSPVQAYGLGIPTVFVQGIGNSNNPFNNYALAFFIQDGWRMHPRLTLNYGVRYDYEHSPLFPASTAVNAAAEDALGVLEGIPRDKNNIAPRIALAWDPWGRGNTVLRAGYGLFYDHPLLAVAFNSTTAEGALSTQLISGGGTPSNISVGLNPLVLNATNIFQGLLNTAGVPLNFGYLPNEQRFDPKLMGSIFADQNFLTAGFPIPILPFTLHVDREFDYGYAQQANLTLEQRIARDYKVSVAYTYTHGLHLNRPRNITPTDPGLLGRNFINASVAGLAPTNPLTVAAPAANRAATASTCGVTVIAPSALGVLSACPGPLAGLNGQFLGTAAFFNFFRPTGPNPSFAGLAGGYPNQVALATLAGFPTGVSGVQIPWSDVVQQESSGNSIYHGMTVNFSKRFSNHFEFLSSWTWAHAIDDSTDLQTLLAPQDNNRPDLERSSSTFDQRHRWVVSSVMQSPYRMSDEGFWKKFLADFTVAPIWEMASGRPFAVLTGNDFNLDFGSNTDRPSVATAGGVASPFINGVAFTLPTVCPADPLTGTPLPSPLGCTGDLGRNPFDRPGFISMDLRIARKFHFNDRWNIDVIADAFNLFNRFNVADVNVLCNPAAACNAGEPTAALDPRQFQFALKINW